ncbi:MAG: NAD(+)/NADH kinase [Actinomycetota bacterium]|nr:NAD(+)/NADH kinase [Actinomycetota bacterium]
MATLALVVHHDREEAAALAIEAVAWLAARGHRVRLPADDAVLLDLKELACDDAMLARGVDVAVAIGGDGTMLRAVRLVADLDVPVLGINAGQLGYLTETDPADWESALDRLLTGSYALDERMLLHVAIDAPSGVAGDLGTHLVLNEAVLEKCSMGHTARLRVCIDGRFFTSYVADGLIVATATGSTAYALSARGPIVAPNLWALLLTPVSPHMLFDRTLVLEPSTELRLEVDGGRPANLSVDGQHLVTLADGDAIVCTAAERPARLVSFGRRDFHGILKSKFGLNDR